MKKLLIVIVIILVAAFIYYSRQNFWEKGRLRRGWENQIEDTTGLDINLRDSLRSLERLEDRILNDRQFQNALEDMSDEARERLQSLDRNQLDKMIQDLEEGAEEYQEVLEEYLGD